MLICETYAQGIYAIGICAQGIYAQGIHAIGIYAQGIYAQGILRTAISTGTKNCVFGYDKTKPILSRRSLWRSRNKPNMRFRLFFLGWLERANLALTNFTGLLIICPI
jgi:hypothetical protein